MKEKLLQKKKMTTWWTHSIPEKFLVSFEENVVIFYTLVIYCILLSFSLQDGYWIIGVDYTSIILFKFFCHK
jgi:hypothetical protein